jgi:hypothetical protein
MNTTLHRIFPLAAAVAALLAFAPSAFATRYATPTPAPGADCHTQATACDVITAIEGVAGNKPVSKEEVVLDPGTYDLPKNKSISAGAGALDIHGVDGQPRPVLVAHGADVFHDSFNLRYLEIRSDVGGLGVDYGKLDRLIVEGVSYGGDPVCQCYSGSLTNSVVIALPGSSGQGAGGVTSNGGSPSETMRNDTFISQSATAPALRVDQVANGSIDYKAFNVIARNTAGGDDVASTGAGTKLTLTHSAFTNATSAGGATIVDGGGNVAGAPVFVDAANGDYREAAASPTIDAGTNDPLNGAVDFAGDPRQRGAATDIGAFEAPPAPPAPPAQPSEPPAASGASAESPAPTTSTDGGSPSGGDAGTAPATDASAPVATPVVVPATATPTVAKRCVKRTVTVRRHGKRVHVKQCVTKKKKRARSRRHR